MFSPPDTFMLYNVQGSSLYCEISPKLLWIHFTIMRVMSKSEKCYSKLGVTCGAKGKSRAVAF